MRMSAQTIFVILAVVKISMVFTQESISCTQYIDLDYHCVSLQDCDLKRLFDPLWYENYVEQDKSLSDKNKNRFFEARKSECGKVLEVCCPSPLITRPHISCGVRNEAGLDEIQHHSGISSKFGEWPHVCIILQEDPNTGRIITSDFKRRSASLIAPDILLTAATSVSSYEHEENLVARCGDWHLQFENETRSHQRQAVEKIILHPKFNSRNHHNNFAIIKTKGHFRYQDHVRPVCLPDPDLKPEHLNDCFTSGWGKDSTDANHPEDVQKTLKVDIISNKECQERFRRTKLSEYFILDDSFVCGEGYLDADTCHGDGGSPLVCHLKSTDHQSTQYVQVGIVSWGLECNTKTPDAFASVMHGICWIDKAISAFTIDEEDDNNLVMLSEEIRRKCKNRFVD